MNDDTPEITELDPETADKLVRRAKQTSYYTHLTDFLSNELEEQVPDENVQAFERESGLRVVSITDSVDRDTLPHIALTFVFEGNTITQAAAEVNPQSSSGMIQTIYPTDFALHPEEDSAEIGLSVASLDDVTIREYTNVTVYEISPAMIDTDLE